MVSMDKFMMNTHSCCCCFNLRTGTLILLWSSVVGAVLQVLSLMAGSNIPNDPRYQQMKPSPFQTFYVFQVSVLAGITAAFGLYGISNRRPSFLKPYIYLNIIQIAVVVILSALAILLALFATSVLKGMIGDAHDLSSVQKEEAQTFASFIMLVIFLAAVITLSVVSIGWYYTSVVYRYYKQLKAEVFPYQGNTFNAPPGYADAQMKA